MGDPQKPTPGRIVVFSGEDANGVKSHPAIITRVWSDECVNLTVFFDAKAPEPRTSVTKGNPTIGWEWPTRS